VWLRKALIESLCGHPKRPVAVKKPPAREGGAQDTQGRVLTGPMGEDTLHSTRMTSFPPPRDLLSFIYPKATQSHRGPVTAHLRDLP
jgi:hypothetical protein